MAVGFAMPTASHYLVGADVWGLLFAIVLILVLQHALALVSGVSPASEA
jgi:hypothetical protein